MKKLTAILLAVISAFAIVLSTGCKNTEGKIVVAVPDGAPTLTLFSVMDTVNNLEGYSIEYKVLSGAENIKDVFVSGGADCAVMPVNVAATLYNKGIDLKLLSVNVFGVLYLVGSNELESAESLKGKVVVTIGQGGTPDISFKRILDGYNVPYVDGETAVEGKVALNYVADAPTAMRTLAQGKADYAILGEPVVTTACKNLGVKIVMDIQKEWSKFVGADTFMQAGLVMSQKVYENEALTEALLNKLSKNADYIMTKPEKVKQVIQKFGSSIQVDFTAEILSRCNLGCERASDVKDKLGSYFTAILGYKPEFIGGKLPDEGFYA